MRDPARIDRILDAVRTVWVAQPDTRLGQLISNACNPVTVMQELFYLEDEELERRFIEYGRGQTRHKIEKALRWLSENPGAHPANIRAVAEDALKEALGGL